MPHQHFGFFLGNFPNAEILSEVGLRRRRGCAGRLKSGEFQPSLAGLVVFLKTTSTACWAIFGRPGNAGTPLDRFQKPCYRAVPQVPPLRSPDFLLRGSVVEGPAVSIHGIRGVNSIAGAAACSNCPGLPLRASWCTTDSQSRRSKARTSQSAGESGTAAPA
jgi:hypothetical protein